MVNVATSAKQVDETEVAAASFRIREVVNPVSVAVEFASVATAGSDTAEFDTLHVDVVHQTSIKVVCSVSFDAAGKISKVLTGLQEPEAILNERLVLSLTAVDAVAILILVDARSLLAAGLSLVAAADRAEGLFRARPRSADHPFARRA